jgi:hypothetical protein
LALELLGGQRIRDAGYSECRADREPAVIVGEASFDRSWTPVLA